MFCNFIIFAKGLTSKHLRSKGIKSGANHQILSRYLTEKW